MNRTLLLLLSVLAINLFGKVLSPEMWRPQPSKSTVHTKAATPAPLTNRGAEPVLMDTVPPVLNCPVSANFLLQTQGACDTVLNYSVTATDNQGPAIVIQLSGLPSGSTFPIGLSTCVFLATDLTGNTATCSFSFNVQDGGVILLTCLDQLTVDLDANCMKALLAKEVLKNGPYGCWSRYVTEVDKTAPLGDGPWISALFGPSDNGKNYRYRVTDMHTSNNCTGMVKIQDKIPPVFNCKDITISCTEDSLSPDFLIDSLGLSAAIPQVEDACGGLSFIGHFDTNILLDCDSPFTAIVNRVWQANDQSGNSSTCLQQIKRHRHTVPEMQMPPDLTLVDPDINTDPSVTGRPFVIYEGRRYDMKNNSICDISAFYTDHILPLPCGDKRVRRLWELFDFCSGITTGPFLQTIFLEDKKGPVFTCPEAFTVSINSDTCHGMVDLPDIILNDVSSQVATIQAFWEDNGLSKTLVGSLADFAGNDPTSYDTMGVLGLALLPIGTSTISYVSEDSCGNTGDCTFNLTVADMVPPVAYCDSLATFSLGEDGLLAVGVGMLDNGSVDNCTPVSFKARLTEVTGCLYDTLWADSLRFCCLNQNDTLNAVLRVYDIPVPGGNVSGSFGAGHFSDCALKILITDSNPPLCTAPPNLTVNCADLDPTLELYGSIQSNSCSVDSMALEVDYSQFDTLCKKGTITRIFKVYDSAGNVGGCAQALTVNYLQDYFTKFPDDMIETACDGTNYFGEPSFFGQDCEQFDLAYTDQIFDVIQDACYKIERTWKITNRCTYNPNKPLIQIPNPNPNSDPNNPANLPGPIVSPCNTIGIWEPTIIKVNPTDPTPTLYCNFWVDTANGYEYKQIIKVIDFLPPTGTYVVPECANQTWTTPNNPQFWNEMYWWDNALGLHDLSEEPTELSITGTDACSGSNITLSFLLYLDLDGDGVTETVINSDHLGAVGLGWNNILFNNANTPNYLGGTSRAFDERPIPNNQKVGFALEEKVSGNTKTAWVRWNTNQQPNTYFPPELPHGTHKIKWFLTDNCGNNKQYEYPFTVKDCKKPTVVCLQNVLSVNMVPSGLITLSAADFLQYAEDNCTPADQIKIAIRKCGTGNGFPVDANGNPVTNINFTCAEIGSNCVEIWAKDKAGNADFCSNFVNLHDSLSNCVLDTISGRIVTAAGDGISDVSIEIKGSCNFCPPISSNVLTDSNGYYHLDPSIPLSAGYSLVPVKNDNPLNGVTTYDLVLISKHILATEPLNSPYKMIAADVNKSGSITSFDVVELRKLILGIYNVLPNNKSWRFVDKTFAFPNPFNPFQTGFPDSISVGNPLPYNFYGIKVGDLNNTAVPNALAPAQERFAGTVYFNTENRAVQEGEIFELIFNASEGLEGCQFTLETDDLSILDILPGENMSKENFALFPQRSLLTMAWETGGQAQFTLKLKALKAGNLQNMLRISDQITPAEAYQSTSLPVNQFSSQPITKSRLALRFGNPSISFELFQNQPNPFTQKTVITFQLPVASTAVLTILDNNGKVLWTKTGDYTAGLNTLDIDLTGLSGAGVLYYKLETPQQSAMRKMVRI